MLRSLRSRLLLSYFVVIVTTLLIVAAAFLVIGSQPRVRYVPSLQRLDAISRVSRNELVRLWEAGADTAVFLRVLEQTAAANNVRIVLADARNREVIYDTHDSNSWMGVRIEGVAFPRRLLPTADPNTIAGLFEHPDGSSWLVYSRSISNSGFGRVLVFYTEPEPTPFAFFQQLFLGNFLGAAGLIAFLLAILLAFAIAGSVARPLQQMAGAAEAIAQGDYDQQLPLQGPEEVQRLAASFNSMATQVKAWQQAQRDFVANVSHDLKTPVTSISGWSQALLDGTADTAEEQQRAAGIIHNEAGRMARLVSQLLDLVRIESGQLALSHQRVDLSQLLTDVYHTFLPQAQAQKIHLTLDVTPVPPLQGDPDRLIQVFTNLVENALKHTPANGRVHLAVQRHDDQAVEVTVQDTGAGIPPQELPRIFERFYQVDKSRSRANGGGSGLGLAIVRELVEAHHGLVKARSQVGQGSLFLVRLPLSQTPAGSTAQ